jgi:hypothetical protein
MILHAASTNPSETPEDWVDQLETNSHGVRLLTLRRAFELAAKGCCAGWYISPFAVKWTVGRMARNGRRYHVLSDGEPMCFDSVAEAFQFLGGILRLAAAPQVALDFPRLLVDGTRDIRPSL